MCFNEGGADCPPIAHMHTELAEIGNGFNEGGADCPPIEFNLMMFLVVSRMLQ